MFGFLRFHVFPHLTLTLKPNDFTVKFTPSKFFVTLGPKHTAPPLPQRNPI